MKRWFRYPGIWASARVYPGPPLPPGALRQLVLRAGVWRVAVEISVPWRRKQ